MLPHRIEHHIRKRLAGAARANALAFAAHLRASGMPPVRFKDNYWKGKSYWAVQYRGEYVCFILLNGSPAQDKSEPEGWVVWFEDGGSDCFAAFPADEATKETAWANVDIFQGDCGGGQCEGLRKVIFGKEFESLYRTLLCFNNPDAGAVGCMKKLVEIIAAHH